MTAMRVWNIDRVCWTARTGYKAQLELSGDDSNELIQQYREQR